MTLAILVLHLSVPFSATTEHCTPSILHVSILITRCLYSLINDDCKFLKSCIRGNILHIDTEQTPYEVNRMLKTIRSISPDVNFEYLHTYSLRPFDKLERLQAIKELLNNGHDFKILIIDGLRELVSDINSPEESTLVITELMKIADEYKVAIICVLHQNKGDNNARGHIGSELVNKSETVISSQKGSGINYSIIKQNRWYILKTAAILN